ncbi:uncharacterized protein LOC135695247 [Rhopilema esculentum]|uniref:uncharacterized protein LOC135695247 n=1 Tax=Rhopilema esculentum TaxID=499914 RepID=UPI0031E3C94F|eukprot:gene11199-21342_t
MNLVEVPLTSLKSGKLKYKLLKPRNASKPAPISPGRGPLQDEALEGSKVAKGFANTPKKINDEEQIVTGLEFPPIRTCETATDERCVGKGDLTGEVQKAGNVSHQEGRIGAGGAPEAVRQILENAYEDDNGEGQVCQLLHEQNTPRIYFKIPDAAATKASGKNQYCVLQCADISAGDLRVITKFGSWDSMVARILIECDGPMLLWKQSSQSASAEAYNKNVCPTAKYEYLILKSCMVKATFPVEYISMVCKMMHLVKVEKTREILQIKDLKKSGIISKRTKLPSKIREGLPEWVNYIPYQWYSAKMRRAIEYALITYTILSLLWAVWQLYRHVDFIRSYLKPIVQFIEHYLSMFKTWFQWIDDLFAILSHYWWHYLKPIIMLLVAALSPIFQIFRPLKGIINIIPHLCAPFIQLFNMIYLFIKPIITPFKASFGVISQYFVLAFTTVFSNLMSNPTVAHIIKRSSEFYVVQLIHEALHGHLDPLKAQMVVIRDLIFKSSRKIYYGLRFIMNKTYFMILFFRREREYSNEGRILEQSAQKETKLKDE